MDFFQAQEVARKKTKLLVFYFILAIVGIIIAVYGLLVALMTVAAGGETATYEGPPAVEWWQPSLLLVAAIGSMTVILLGSLFKVLQLSSGGAKVARELGGRLISPDTTDPDERRLLNVVEEMAIASGTPVPNVYLLDHEEGINAFAAGYSPSDAVIGVTRGCMQLLSRDELQGVIAHEFSHVLNGDMRLNIRLMGLLFGIVMITVLGRIVMRSAMYASSSRSRKEGGGGALAILLFGVGLLVIGSIGVFFARLIQAAVSRQREYLADASAVQFTRLPDGIAGALIKIGGLAQGSHIQDPHAEEASHMFFADGIARRMVSSFATHPPLPTRIRAILPQWDGKFVRPTRANIELEEQQRARRRSAHRDPRAAGFAGSVAMAAASGHAEPSASPIPAFAQPNDAQMSSAVRVHAALPEPLIERLRQPNGAQVVLLGLLLSRQAELQRKQIDLLRGTLDPGTLDAIAQAHGEVTTMPSQQKLVLVDLAIPALRQLSASDYDRFVQRMRLVVDSDQRVDLFEFTLEKILQNHLDTHFQRRSRPRVRFNHVRNVAGASAILLSALARVGARGQTEAEQAAFQAGLSSLKVHEPRLHLELLPAAHCGLQAVGYALDQLEQAGPLVKRAVLDACSQVVLADDLVTDQEAELIRAIADSLGTPLPIRVQAQGTVDPVSAASAV